MQIKQAHLWKGFKELKEEWVKKLLGLMVEIMMIFRVKPHAWPQRIAKACALQAALLIPVPVDTVVAVDSNVGYLHAYIYIYI